MSFSSKEFFYGWDLLYKTIENEINKKDDLLIAMAHFILTKQSQFLCIGIGDDKTLPEDDENSGSELLPNNWNHDDNNYALRYTHNKQLYILLGLRTEGSLIITLLDVKTRKVSNIGLDPEDLVKVTKGNLKTMIPNASELVDRYQNELLEPVFAGNSKTVTTQTAAASTSTTNERADDLRIGPPRRPCVGMYPPPPFGYPVGRGDLDPLGRSEGGNLFTFPSSPDIRLDPNLIRPRPRFDPFVTPDRNIRPNPNPDHMAPPDFNRDYYM